MPRKALRARAGSRVLGPTLVALFLAPPLLAQSLFDRIPPLTTACYSEPDRYDEEIAELRYALEAEVEAAQAANTAITSAIDLAQQQQRLMVAMQSDPQRAMAMMQLQQTLPIEANEFAMAAYEREQAFDAEANALAEEYGAALTARTASLDAQIAALSDPGGDLPSNYMQLLEGLYQQWDAEYAALCGEWFGPDGRFAGPLAGLRSYLLDEWLPEEKRLNDLKNEHLAFFGGVDTSRLVFTGEQEAAIRYIGAMQGALAPRETAQRRDTRGGIGQ
jgi:hypothetical protein